MVIFVGSMNFVLFFWVFLYGFSYSLAETVTHFTGGSLWVTPLTMLGYCLLLFFWLIHTNRAAAIGLSPVRLHAKTDLIYLIPLLILPVLNLSGTAPMNPPHYTLLMISVCFAEELLFRGFLLSFLIRHLGRWGIFCSALAFSLLHCVNFFSDMPASYVLIQILLALFVGIYYSLVRLCCKSLYPCIIAHFLTNITASADAISLTYTSFHIVTLTICGFVLYFKISSELEDLS